MSVCNASNHRWNCDCGFGGAKGSRSTQRASTETGDLFVVPKVPRRHTKPNKRCSFCNAPVFFRQLANGGRVYFDDPGSPWRKHPCTNPASALYLGPFGETEANWPQVTQIAAEAVSPVVFRLTGELAGEDWYTFVRTDSFGSDPISAAHLCASYIQAKLGLNGNFHLAVLTPDIRHRLVVGHPSAATAASWHA